MSPSKATRTFKVVLYPELDGSGWNAEIPAIQGCHSCGRSLTEARRNIRECLSLFEEELGDADAVARDALFEEDIQLPASLRAAIRRFHSAREKADAEAAKLREASAAAARVITETLSLRDAGELLGLSQEGVRKVLKAGESPPPKPQKKTRQR